MYGFNLGVISGLSRDIPVLNITLNNGTSNTYTVSYYDGIWRDDVDEPTIVLALSEETNECAVILTTLTSEDVGDEYTINLSLPETPTQVFKEAVGMVMIPLIFSGPPQELYDLIAAALMAAMPAVIAADGKFCSIPDVIWNYDDAENKTAYVEYESEIKNIAQHREIPAFSDTNQITSRFVDLSNSSIGFVTYDFSTSGYKFILSTKYSAYKYSATRYISYSATAALITSLS